MSDILTSTYMIRHLFPLRSEVLAGLILPNDLTTEEAERLAVFLVTLALEVTDDE